MDECYGPRSISGSSIGLLTASGIDRMGVTPDVLAADPAGAVNGVGRFTVATRRHDFRTLRVGAESITDPTIWAAPVHILPTSSTCCLAPIGCGIAACGYPMPHHGFS